MLLVLCYDCSNSKTDQGATMSERVNANGNTYVVHELQNQTAEDVRRRELVDASIRRMSGRMSEAEWTAEWTRLYGTSR